MNTEDTGSRQSPITLLIADDDRDHCYATKSILEASGYRILLAHDGETTLEKVFHLHPRLVMLDSMLPQKPGLDCLRAIRRHPSAQSLPVIMCSGKGDLDYVLECTEAGADGFLHKPFDAEDLVVRIDRVLRA